MFIYIINNDYIVNTVTQPKKNLCREISYLELKIMHNSHYFIMQSLMHYNTL